MVRSVIDMSLLSKLAFGVRDTCGFAYRAGSNFGLLDGSDEPNNVQNLICVPLIIVNLA